MSFGDCLSRFVQILKFESEIIEILKCLGNAEKDYAVSRGTGHLKIWDCRMLSHTNHHRHSHDCPATVLGTVSLLLSSIMLNQSYLLVASIVLAALIIFLIIQV